MKSISCLFMLTALVLFSGCAGVPLKVGSQRIVEKSAIQQPEWLQVPFYEKKEMMYFSGTVKGVGDYAVGLRQAKAEAMKNVAESIQTKARTEFIENTRGVNLSTEDLGRFVQDGIAMVADNINISGLFPIEYYYEKVEEITESGVRYFFNCSALLKLPESDYKTGRKMAIKGLASKARKQLDKDAELAAVKLLEKLED
ncbi:MAG: hypothetical protein ABIH89_06450 [Elusimicrobiota bacterium]